MNHKLLWNTIPTIDTPILVSIVNISMIEALLRRLVLRVFNWESVTSLKLDLAVDTLLPHVVSASLAIAYNVNEPTNVGRNNTYGM
jgi:hypothetical protein